MVTKAGGNVAPRDLRRVFASVPTATLMAAVSALLKAGRLKRLGVGRGSKYFPAASAAKEVL